MRELFPELLSEQLTEEERRKLARQKSKKLGYNLEEAIYPVNPLLLPQNDVNEQDIENLRKWSKISTLAQDITYYTILKDPLWYTPYIYVAQSIEKSLWEPLRESIYPSVLAAIKESVTNSVRKSVRNSVDESAYAYIVESIVEYAAESVREYIDGAVKPDTKGYVRDSIFDSIYAYHGSMFFDIKKWKCVDHEEDGYPLQPAVNLWYRGFIPSFDGKVWRLHSGKDAKIVYEATATVKTRG